ncbi:MAG: 7TM diverse intracellular signaling domain-containing protein, partial [Pseudoxanthomonas sp.]
AARAPSAAAPPARGWQPVSLPDSWTRRWPGYDGVVWYRLRWQRGCAAPVAFALDYLNMAGAFYVNDQLLWRDVSLVEPFSRSWNMPRYARLPDALVHPGSNTLTVAVSGLAAYSPGLGTVTLGTPATVYPVYRREHLLRRTLSLVTVTTALTLTVFFCVLWLMRRRETIFGWFALMMLAWCVYALNLVVTAPSPFATTHGWERVMSLALIVFASSFVVFAWRLLGQRRPRLEGGLWAAALLQGAVLLLAPAAYLGPVRTVLSVASVSLFLAGCIQVLVAALRRRGGGEVGILAVCMAGFIGMGVHDLLVFLDVLDSNLYYSALGAQLLVVSMALVLAGRFARSMRRIEGFSAELEATVARTREELRRTLEHGHALAIENAHMSGRLALARDLHDGLGGTLVGAIARIEHGGAAAPPAQWLALLKDLREDLRQVIDANTSHTTPVPTTPEEWLAPLRSRYGQMCEETGIAAAWEVPAAWPRPLTPLQALALTRVLQEACTNVLKHSQARTLRVCLDAAPEGVLRLAVEDDGVGFEADPARQGSGGVGLASMAERMQRIGASLDIHSRPGGTRLVVLLPAPAHAACNRS